MKNFVRVLASVLLIVGIANFALGRFVLKNNDDGTVDWQNTVGDAGGGDILYPAGAVYLTVRIPDLSTASSTAVVSPVTRVRISRIDSTIDRTITSAVTYFFFTLSSTLTEASLTSEQVTNGTGPLTITANADMGELDTFIPNDTTHARLERGGKIIIEQAGQSGGAAAVGYLTITLEPY